MGVESRCSAKAKPPSQPSPWKGEGAPRPAPTTPARTRLSSAILPADSAATPAAGPQPARQPWPAWTASAGWVLGALALWLLCTAWARPLLLPDEGRYGEVARQMWLGDGLVPMLNGVPFFHKPPLSYWVNMLGLSVFGPVPFAVRLAPALGAWLMGAALWLTLRRRAGAQVAGTSLLVLATSPFFFIGGQYANHDMLVAGTISAAVLSFVRALAPPPAGAQRGRNGTCAGCCWAGPAAAWRCCPRASSAWCCRPW